MYASALVLALAGASMAMPTARQSSSFTISISLDNGATNGTLTAVADGSTYLLIANDGTPSQFTFDQTSQGLALNVAVDGGSDGVNVGDIGQLEGVAEQVYAASGDSDFGWQQGGGVISHQVTAGDQLFLACSISQGVALSWGAANSDGSWPAGCSPTTVYQN